MQAAIDVGTNTVRLLLGRLEAGRVVPHRYHRVITRLGGGATVEKGLAPAAVERTLFALEEIAAIVAAAGVSRYRAVGTEALRRAPNGQSFAELVLARTGLLLEIINGEEEARLSALGVLADLHPRPESCLIFDIGGGSTEFVLWHRGKIVFQKSYPLGVVSLCEQWPEEAEQKEQIQENLFRLTDDLQKAGQEKTARSAACRFVGTAGTVTTLAALQLKMTEYDRYQVNNLLLLRKNLFPLLHRLEKLSPLQREDLPGMEKGRGDLIVPGLRLVLAILDIFNHRELVVIDSGIIEGILLSTAGQQGGAIDIL
jgi:exopolyphosphatase/guanosine-5'-triphosphate,3'-diphosphate pyrophosphatase